MKCPACGSMNIRENSGLVKAESGDWGICRDCHFVIRLEVVCPSCNGEGKLPKNPEKEGAETDE